MDTLSYAISIIEGVLNDAELSPYNVDRLNDVIDILEKTKPQEAYCGLCRNPKSECICMSTMW